MAKVLSEKAGFFPPSQGHFFSISPNLHLQQNPTNLQNHATRSNLTTVSILSCNQQSPPISPPYSATTEHHTTPTPTPSPTFNPLPDEPPPDDHWSFCSHHPTNPLKVPVPYRTFSLPVPSFDDFQYRYRYYTHP
ncbi:hypothetical protein HanIR_Chr12g0592931 [Helianthus annuus]|nr:hypothetical protein HanIR_Chr12g0592931 [Helianthus annuus]